MLFVAMLLIAMLFVDLLFVKTDRLDATEYLEYLDISRRRPNLCRKLEYRKSKYPTYKITARFSYT